MHAFIDTHRSINYYIAQRVTTELAEDSPTLFSK